MARLYRFFFFFLPYIQDPFLCVRGPDDEEKREKKKEKKIGPVCWSCASKKSRFVRPPRPAYFYGRKLFFFISPRWSFSLSKIFLSGHSKSDGNGREHNGHLFSNRIGVIGVATGLCLSTGQRKWEEFSTMLVFRGILKNRNLKEIYSLNYLQFIRFNAITDG